MLTKICILLNIYCYTQTHTNYSKACLSIIMYLIYLFKYTRGKNSNILKLLQYMKCEISISYFNLFK